MQLLTIMGSKVQLRSFTKDDITSDYLGWLKDPVVTRYSNQRFHTHSRESCWSYLRSFTGTPNLFLSIVALDSGQVIGTMTAYIAPQHGTADIGILIGDRSVWGKGYGQDAWDALANHLASLPGMRKLTAGTLACNEAMVRIIEGSGMKLEASRKAQELVDGEPVDIVYFARFVR